MKTETVWKVELAFDVARAKLGVAEELRSPIAALAVLLCHEWYDSWLVAGAIGFLLLLLVPYWYSKEYDRARDEYEMATGTGKYYSPPASSDAK